MAEDVEHFFMYILVCCTSFVNCLFSPFAHSFRGVLILWEVRFLSSLYIFCLLIPCHVGLAKIFLSLHRLVLQSSDLFAMQKRFSLMQFHLLVLFLNSWAIGVVILMLLSMPIYYSVFPVLSCSSFTVSDLTLR
jgi:hypothetical protein